MSIEYTNNEVAYVLDISTQRAGVLQLDTLDKLLLEILKRSATNRQAISQMWERYYQTLDLKREPYAKSQRKALVAGWDAEGSLESWVERMQFALDDIRQTLAEEGAEDAQPE